MPASPGASIRAALGTGLRESELLGLKWDVDLQAGAIRVRRAFREGTFYEPKTETSRRTASATKLLLELKRWKLPCPKGELGRARVTDRRRQPAEPEQPAQPRAISGPTARRAAPRTIPRSPVHVWKPLDRGRRGSENRIDSAGSLAINVTVDIYGHMLKARAAMQSTVSKWHLVAKR
jgi:integrase